LSAEGDEGDGAKEDAKDEEGSAPEPLPQLEQTERLNESINRAVLLIQVQQKCEELMLGVQAMMYAEYETQAKREERLLGTIQYILMHYTSYTILMHYPPYTLHHMHYTPVSLAEWAMVMLRLCESLESAIAKATRHHELAVEDLVRGSINRVC
jgi:hypothetical protein